MGISYKVQEYGGTVVASGERYLTATMVEALDPVVYPMLGHICPYDDTMFNSWQVHTLIKELHHIPDSHPLDPTIREDLRALCDAVLAKPHRQLWFIGD
ncbi:hypothetical protein [Microtetraspora glauca]|uniref:Uncharacterized protein n=1 Tax=Microtetraspora glauca TaxID=1996 RepID=A0ABV3GTU4_MICGL